MTAIKASTHSKRAVRRIPNRFATSIEGFSESAHATAPKVENPGPLYPFRVSRIATKGNVPGRFGRQLAKPQ
jgi:hypothetical protein